MHSVPKSVTYAMRFSDQLCKQQGSSLSFATKLVYVISSQQTNEVMGVVLTS